MNSSESSLFTQKIEAPYPGLRPFQPHEWPIFFGRREHVADMLTILENHRFLAVVGPSGGGKSSLVLAGLVPSLRRGELLTARSNDWRFVILRPGDAPYRNLANAAQQRLWVDREVHRFHDGDESLTETVLRGSPFGFLDTLRDAVIPEATNVLLLVDQFEELFRFRSHDLVGPPAVSPRNGDAAAIARRRDDAALFVQLLLETAKQSRRPVYVMLTMRTDFLGDCDVFDGLPEAINQSQYLTPRLNLSQLTESIVRPLEKDPFRGTVAPEVVQRILNDIGTGRDELPIVQHALFLTWQERKRKRPSETVQLTLAEYEAVGGLKDALSRHADEVLEQFKERGQEMLVEKVFCGLSMRTANGQQVRRPATIQQLADESGYSVDQVMSVVEIFRRSECSFLVPPPDIEHPMTPATKIDISHESLLREWQTLKGWIETEAHSAAIFIRLRDAALGWPEKEPLLIEPTLSIALNWRNEQHPSSAWAERHGGGLDPALKYLDESVKEHERQLAAEDADRRKELERARQRAMEQAASARRFRNVAVALALLSVVAIGAAIYAWVMRRQIESLTTTQKQLVKTQDRIRNEISDAIGQQQKLRSNNEVLAKVTAAYGSVSQIAGGNVSVLFHQSAISPDGVLPLLERMGNVQSLNLTNTSVSDGGLAALAKLPDLRSLDLSFTEITDGGLSHLAALQHLANLALNDSMISDDGLVHLRALKGLKTLDLSRNRLSRKAVVALSAQLKDCVVTYDPDPLLEALAANHGNWNVALKVVGGERDKEGWSFYDSPITDAALRHLSRQQVGALDLSYCPRVTNDGMKYLKAIPNLRSLKLQNCSQVSNVGMAEVAAIPKLHTAILDLAITDQGLRILSQAQALTTLRIEGASHHVTDEGLSALPQLQRLQHLALQFCEGKNTIKYISKLSNLRDLELMVGREEITSASSWSLLAQLPHLRSLDISYDAGLTDANLKYLAELTQLRTLKLVTINKNVTEEGISRLKAALPNTYIEWRTFSPPSRE